MSPDHDYGWGIPLGRELPIIGESLPLYVRDGEGNLVGVGSDLLSLPQVSLLEKAFNTAELLVDNIRYLLGF